MKMTKFAIYKHQVDLQNRGLVEIAAIRINIGRQSYPSLNKLG